MSKVPPKIPYKYVMKTNKIATASASSRVLPIMMKKKVKAPSLTPKPLIEIGRISVKNMSGMIIIKCRIEISIPIDMQYNLTIKTMLN